MLLNILAALAPEVIIQEHSAVVEELQQFPPLSPLRPLGELALRPALVRVKVVDEVDVVVVEAAAGEVGEDAVEAGNG